RLHREWFERSAMADLLGEDLGLAEIHKLYRCHDRLLEHKQALFDHLVGRWRDLFNISFDVLLYDLTSTYFEADPPFAESDKRRPRLFARSPAGLRAGRHRLGGDPGGVAAGLRGAAWQHRGQHHLARLPGADRAAVRQGEAHLVDGPRHPDRGRVGRDAGVRSPGPIPRRHAQGPPDPIGEGPPREALAAGPAGGPGQAL